MAEFRQQPTATNPGGTELPKGAATQLEQGAEFIEDLEGDDAALEDVLGEEGDEGEGEVEEFEDVEDADALTAPTTGMDALLFGPTKRPTEPITAGAPFGPGPSGTMRLDDDELLGRFLDEAASRTDAPEEIRALKRRFDLGV